MTPLRTAAALAAALAITTLAPAGAQPARSAPVVLKADLRPSGDTDGTGKATVRLRAGAGKVCATITYSRIDAPFAAHIHRKSDGQVVVDLTGSVTDGDSCTSAPSALIRKIVDRPGRYYVNVHNDAHPAGAVQGALHN